jgi:hypothetical protein
VNSSLVIVLGLGLVMGMQHATEADHLAAVASLVGPERSLSRGLRHGIAWGLGHTLTLLLVAGGVIVMGLVISPAMAGRFEQVVGAMLMILGVNLVWRLRRERFHFHGHHHGDGAAHFHVHAHRPRSSPVQQERHLHGHRLPARSVLVGMVHGLAGSAALALLVSQAMPSAAWSVAYVLVFGIGSILGMALLSGALAIPMGLTARRMTRLHGLVNVVVALFSIGLGARLLMTMG